MKILKKNMELLEVSNSLGQGFFADKVVQILGNRGAINESDKAVLKRVKKFLKKVLEGQKQVEAEKLSCNAIETIDAYQKTLMIFRQVLIRKEEKMTAELFQSLMTKMSDEVNQVLEKNEVTLNEKTTFEFFNIIQRQTIDETSEYLNERATHKWPQPATFYRF